MGGCSNNSADTIFELDLATGKMTWRTNALGIGVTAMGLNPRDGKLYILDAYNSSGRTTAYSLQLGSDTPRPLYSYPGYPWPWISPQLAFDNRTGDLLVPSAGNGLFAIDPVSGNVHANISVPGTPLTAMYDPGSDRVYVALFHPNMIVVLDSATYAPVATITVPNCFFGGGVCAEENSVGSMLSDPAHGDVYALSILGLLAINTSSDAIVGSVYDCGCGFVYNAAYDPSLNATFGAWPNDRQDIGFVTTLTHSTVDLGVDLIGLPIPIGILVLGASGGVILTVVRVRGRRPPAGSSVPSLETTDGHTEE